MGVDYEAILFYGAPIKDCPAWYELDELKLPKGIKWVEFGSDEDIERGLCTKRFIMSFLYNAPKRTNPKVSDDDADRIREAAKLIGLELDGKVGRYLTGRVS